MHEDAAKFYHAILMTTTMGEEARNYLYQRGLTDEVLKHFRIGLAPPERNYLYQRLSGQYREEDFLDSGLFLPLRCQSICRHLSQSDYVSPDK